MATEQDLQFGVIALLVGLIDFPGFAEACSTLDADEGGPLAGLLVERGQITPDDRAAVEHLMRAGLEKRQVDNSGTTVLFGHDEWSPQSLAGRLDQALQSTLTRDTGARPAGFDSPNGSGPGGWGRYTRIRLHAQGGMGRVWRAYDTVLGREVALKDPLPSHSGYATARARFLQEGRIASTLEHPGIVPVYDLAWDPGSGDPFYLMRFINGRPLNEVSREFHARRGKGRASTLDLRELLNAFVGVCNAVAYAHSRGVLHRDLKPHNVILGDFGEAILLDWGLAKRMDHAEEGPEGGPGGPAGDSDHDPTLPGQVMGTAGSMPPEQAAGRLDLVDRRSDVYGLGAILYNILTGRAPFSGESVTEVLRRVREEEPTRPAEVWEEVPRALEAVCLRALSKDPSARYDSAEALVGEVRRWLADEPVEAYPDPVTTRLARWGRRHRPVVAGGVTLLITALVGVSIGAAALGRANTRTAAALRQAEANFGLAREAVDRFFTRVSEDRLLNQSGQTRLRKELLEDAAEFYRKFTEQRGGEPLPRSDLGWAHIRLANIGMSLGSPAEAMDHVERSRAIFSVLWAEHPGRLEYLDGLADSEITLAQLCHASGDLPGAEAAFLRALRLYQSLADALPDDPTHRISQANCHAYLGAVHRSNSSPERAIAAFRSALAIHEGLARDPRRTAEHRAEAAGCHFALGGIYHSRGELDAALRENGRSLEIRDRLCREQPDDPWRRNELAASLERHGLILLEQGELAGAEARLREASKIAEGLANKWPEVPSPRFHLANSLICLARACRLSDRPEEAERHRSRAEGLLEDLVHAHPDVLDYRLHLALLLDDSGENFQDAGLWDEAERYRRRSLEVWEGLVRSQPDRPDFLAGLSGACRALGRLATDRDDDRTALVWFDRAIEVSGRDPRRDAHPGLRQAFLKALGSRARVLARLGRETEAIAEWGRALDLATAPGDVARYRAARAHVMARIGDYARAASEADGAVASNPRSGEALYHAACTHAIASSRSGKDGSLPAEERRALAERYSAHAVSLLARAHDVGWFESVAAGVQLDRDLLRDLEPLAAREDFRALLADVRFPSRPFARDPLKPR